MIRPRGGPDVRPASTAPPEYIAGAGDITPRASGPSGVSVKDGRLVRATRDGYLLALDAEDGRLLWARRIADAEKGETFTMAPLIYDNLVIIGPAVTRSGECPAP
ncbi:MAG: hypothetical protein DMF89_16225 [Acidobacteria bacterium]|nr:MAG: hypothetical protein DMF89_16225 [Acidobacteriota bacterium]